MLTEHTSVFGRKGDFPPIPKTLFDELMVVEPSQSGNLQYRPCKTILKNGQILDRVYVVEAESYIDIWGVWPEEDKGKKAISIQDVAHIESSPVRIPAKLADKMYRAGESAMGGCIFTLLFKDGRKLAYVTGNAVDFVKLPQAVTSEMIIDLYPHEGRDSVEIKTMDPQARVAEYYWCLYLKPEWISG